MIIKDCENIQNPINPFFENVNWKDINTLPYRITTEPYLQSYQYKIIKRILIVMTDCSSVKLKRGRDVTPANGEYYRALIV